MRINNILIERIDNSDFKEIVRFSRDVWKEIEKKKIRKGGDKNVE